MLQHYTEESKEPTNTMDNCEMRSPAKSRLIEVGGKDIHFAKLITDPDAGLTVTSLITRDVLLDTVREKQLETIDLADMEWIDTQTLLIMAARCAEQNVETLILDRCTAVNDQVLAQIARSMGSRLRCLKIHGCSSVTLRGVLLLLAMSPNLETFDVGRNPELFTLPRSSPDADLLEFFRSSLPTTLQAGVPIKTRKAILDASQELLQAQQDFAELLQEVNVNLKDLSLRGVRGVDDTFLELLPSKCSLQTLDLHGCMEITDRGIIALAKRCGKLRRLDLSALPFIGDEALKTLAQEAPKLTHLRLAGCVSITGTGLIALAASLGFTLEDLDVANCHDLSIEALKQLPLLCSKLQKLDLSKCEALDRPTLESLATIETLIRIDIEGCFGGGLTKQALDAIQEAKPSLNIYRRRDNPVGLANSGGLFPHWKPLPASQQLKAIAKDSKGSSSSKKGDKKGGKKKKK